MVSNAQFVEQWAMDFDRNSIGTMEVEVEHTGRYILLGLTLLLLIAVISLVVEPITSHQSSMQSPTSNTADFQQLGQLGLLS